MNEQAKHTPGPWFAADTFLNNQPNKIYIRQKKYGGDIVADMGPTREVNMANAALLAAAPDLLDALKACDMAGLFDAKTSELAGINSKFRLAARAAIAKAESH